MSTITKITEKGWFDWTVQETKLLLQNNIFVASFFSFMLFTLCNIYFEIASLHFFERSGNVLICGTDSIRALWTRSIFPTKIVSECHLSAKREYGLNSFLEIFRFFISSFKGLYSISWVTVCKSLYLFGQDLLQCVWLSRSVFETLFDIYPTNARRVFHVETTWNTHGVFVVKEVFAKIVAADTYFRKALSWMFDRVLNMPLIKQGYLLLNNAILHTFYLL